jgi:hypothetical protein
MIFPAQATVAIQLSAGDSEKKMPSGNKMKDEIG